MQSRNGGLHKITHCREAITKVRDLWIDSDFLKIASTQMLNKDAQTSMGTDLVAIFESSSFIGQGYR